MPAHAMPSPPLQAPLLWQTYLGFWIAGIAAAAWPWPACCCALLLTLADARLWRPARLALAVLLALAGCATGQWHIYGSPWQGQGYLLPKPAWLAAANQNLRVCGQVRDVQGLSDNRLRVLLSGVAPAEAPTQAEATPLPGLTAWTWEEPGSAPLPGQTVCLSRRPQPLQGFANRGLTDWGLDWAARGVHWRLWSRGERGAPQVGGQPTRSARWREALRQKFLAALAARALPVPHAADRPAQGRAILAALLFGDRQYLDQKTLNNFASATLAHSLALSGQHLAVAGLAGFLLVLAAARLRPGLYLRRPRALWAVWAALPPALAYLWLGNAPASLLRATAMLLVLALWLPRGRARTSLDVLCAALLCITVVSPLSVLDTGLQLSALCVATIGLILPWLRRLTPRPHRGQTSALTFCLRYGGWSLLRIVLISLCIQLALLPLSVLLFGTMGHWFALNALWLPVVDILVLPGAALGLLLAAAGLTGGAQALLDLAALPCQGLVDALDWLATAGWLENPALLRPHWTNLPAFAALLTALALKAGRARLPSAGRRLLLAGALLLCVGPLLRTAERLSGSVQLDVLDVGQSQALLLRLPGHIRLLLDGSGSASPRFEPGQALVAPVLTYNDAPRLAAVLSSHPDLDHMGGLLYVLRHFSVGKVLDNGLDGKGAWGALWAEARQARKARALARGEVLILGRPDRNLRLEILHPPPLGPETWTDNNASVVARLTHEGRGLALFTGDAERPALRRLLEEGLDVRAEVLVLPHHGSDSGFLQEFYAAVRPRLVLASCGFENRHNYPAPRLRAWLEAAGIPLLYTGRDGGLRIVWPRQGQGFGPPKTHTARGPAKAEQ